MKCNFFIGPFIIDISMNNQNIRQQLVSNLNRYKSLSLLIKITLNCGLSAFYYGYCMTFFNSINYNQIVTIFALQNYPLALMQGILTGSTGFTAAIGTMLSTYLISRYSRRQCLMILSSISILITLLILIPSIYTLAISRLAQGLIIGCISCITPLYIKQLMPKEIYGPMWSLHQVMFVFGTIFGFILSFLLSGLFSIHYIWRIIFGFPLLTSTIQLFNFYFLLTFDTPKWNILNKDTKGAQRTLQILYKEQYISSVLQQVTEANEYSIKKTKKTQIEEAFQAEIQLDELQIDGKIKTHIIKQKQFLQNRNSHNSLALFTAFYLIGQQHFLGSSIVMQYIGEMSLKTFPAHEKSIPMIACLLGLVGSILSIQAMRQYGRRQLLLNSVIILTLCLLLCFLIFSTMDIHSVSSNSIFLRFVLVINFFVIRFAMSIAMGPIPWLYIAEIVQPNILPWCSLLNWTVFGINSTLFPIMCSINNGNPWVVFLINGSVGCISFLIIKKFVIETKNKTELQIRKQYDELYGN